MTAHDAIVVGAGAGGGVVAGVLAEAGKRVLLLERGRALGFATLSRDHLRNHRLPRYGYPTARDLRGQPRVFVDVHGAEHVVDAPDPRYHDNATVVGGGTRVFGAQAWRFLPDDFRMASRYGNPERSSLADWPIGYADLEAAYQRIEWEMGVAGDEASGERWPRQLRYPMSPFALTQQGHVLRQGAERLGWSTLSPPLLINTEPYGGRPRCIQCRECVGFACPVDAKNGTHNTFIERALATGRCELSSESVVTSIDVDASGQVTAVSYVDGTGKYHSVRADIVVCSAGAIETARLLLSSKSHRHPHGLGNQNDQVGRHLQGHTYVRAFGLMEDFVYDGVGPGISIATCEFSHDNPGVVGGGMLADDFIMLPVAFQSQALPPDVPRFGPANKRFMRENYRRVLQVAGPVHEIPNPECRVTLHETLRDRLGLPVARLTGTTHIETVKTAAFLHEKAKQWLSASGATRIWGGAPSSHLSAGQHQAGTCRMGADPKTSVVDSFGRVHGHSNLYIADGSVHVTNGGFNPVLTILALAYRTAELIVKQW